MTDTQRKKRIIFVDKEFLLLELERLGKMKRTTGN